MDEFQDILGAVVLASLTFIVIGVLVAAGVTYSWAFFLPIAPALVMFGMMVADVIEQCVECRRNRKECAEILRRL